MWTYSALKRCALLNAGPLRSIQLSGWYCDIAPLFVVYASKLFEIVQDHLPNAHCFADDTQLYLSFDPNSPTDQAMALEAMERCISDLRKWMYRDKLKINDDKTEFLVIGSRQQLLKIHHCSVRVGTIDIKPVKVERNLSASLDSHFSMSTHIS